MDMKKKLNIRCRDLGVDHDGFVSGDSIKSLVNCVQREVRKMGVAPATGVSDAELQDAVRSALLQASRPAPYRSVDLSKLLTVA